MKKLVLLIVVIAVAQLSFAGDAGGSSASASFNQDFHRAIEVQWQHSQAYDMVSFVLDDRFMNAYYTPDGELMAVTRNITSEQLPLKLLLELKKNYSAMWISDLFEVANGSDDDYYVTLENADEKLILKAKSNKSWKLYKKVVKL